MRACIDWPSGEGAVIADPIAFLQREAVDPPERVYAMTVLRQGHTYRDQRGRWSLTPIPERTP